MDGSLSLRPACLVYRASSRTAKASKRNHVSYNPILNIKERKKGKNANIHEDNLELSLLFLVFQDRVLL